MALLCKLGLSECDGCGRCFEEKSTPDTTYSYDDFTFDDHIFDEYTQEE